MKLHLIYGMFLLLWLTNSSLAQIITTDIIYLKNGSIIKGEIQKNTEKETKIKIVGGSILVIAAADIETITVDKDDEIRNPLLKIKPNGWYNNVMLGMGINPSAAIISSQIALTTLYSLSFSLEYTTGYRFYPGFGVGLGIGVMNYYDDLSLPIYANIQGYFLKSPTNIYYNLDIGYGVDLNVSHSTFQWNGSSAYREGGLFMRPAIGVRFPSTKKFSMLMDFGVRIQTGRYIYRYADGFTSITPLDSYLPSFRVGITF